MTIKWSEIVKQVEAVNKVNFLEDPEVVAIVYNSTDGGMTTVRDAVDEDGFVDRDEYDKIEFLFAEPWEYPAGSGKKLQLVFQLKGDE